MDGYLLLRDEGQEMNETFEAILARDVFGSLDVEGSRCFLSRHRVMRGKGFSPTETCRNNTAPYITRCWASTVYYAGVGNSYLDPACVVSEDRVTHATTAVYGWADYWHRRNQLEFVSTID